MSYFRDTGSIRLDVIPLFLGDPPAGARTGGSEHHPQDGPEDADDAGHVEHRGPAPGASCQGAGGQQLDDGTELSA